MYEEIITKLSLSIKDTYTKKEVIHIINNISIKPKTQKSFKPRKGDVVGVQYGYKQRPCVIFGTKDDMAYCIPLSTTKDAYNIMKTNDRLFGEYFGNGIATLPIDKCSDKFLGTFTNIRQLNKAIKITQKNIIEF